MLAAFVQAQGATFPRGTCDQVLYKTHYTICYSARHRQAAWTSHLLSYESVNGKAKRSNRFQVDYQTENPVFPEEYKDSGFDRGHLVPAADMKLSRQAMRESFLMSNMSPQHPQMNRGLWSSLENTIRFWVRNYGDTWVVTAPVLNSKLRSLHNGIAVPQYFYKIVYVPSQELMAAFLVPNIDTSNQSFWKYATTVDKIEELTGFDFFTELPKALEDRLERKKTSSKHWPLSDF